MGVAFNMSDEKFDLTWNDFGSNAVNTIRNLFTDVTLISDDRKRIKAHKVILNSSSQFFKEILIETSSEQPLLFIKGIKHAELEAIIKFIYVGSTEIAQKDIGKFMKAAEDLQIEGLQEKNKSPNKFELTVEYGHTNTNSVYSGYNEILLTDDDILYDMDTHTENSQHDRELDHKTNMSSNIGPLQNSTFEKKSDGKYSCPKCEYQTTYSNSLRRHNLAIHERVRFKCNQCDSEFTVETNLQRHKQAKHEGKKFICTDCDLEFPNSTSLSRHRAKAHK